MRPGPKSKTKERENIIIIKPNAHSPPLSTLPSEKAEENDNAQMMGTEESRELMEYISLSDESCGSDTSIKTTARETYKRSRHGRIDSFGSDTSTKTNASCTHKRSKQRKSDGKSRRSVDYSSGLLSDKKAGLLTSNKKRGRPITTNKGVEKLDIKSAQKRLRRLMRQLKLKT
ncbi:hypothetical protein PUN28_019720 [Cardiocondyla obscurior]|uniref:Uncharacterized protein n=1 Tax=Cardiocondyla obscurior TaxID=286306 RepID=A0AAW2EBG8_9HYME